MHGRISARKTGQIMKNKFIDALKRFLIKYYLPLKKKKNGMLGRLRLSMTFRIVMMFFIYLALGGAVLISLLYILHPELTRDEMFDLAVIYVAIAAVILKLAGENSRRLFAPLREMSDAAKKLTVNNIKTEQLNVEGTKNELKDLAVTYNEMLKRLNDSFERQKQFVSDASHQLRTPIAAISGYADMLERWGKDDPAILDEAVFTINNKAKEMSELVTKLLYISRHDRNTVRLNKEFFDMRELIAEIITDEKLVIHDREITYDMPVSVIVYADRELVRQAIQVFVDNAGKYTRDGDRIHITLNDADGDCQVSVADTGIGMKREAVQNIFGRFYRAQDVKERKISGNGLGLALARMIILEHCGRIRIRSQYEKGTTFTITFPMLWYTKEALIKYKMKNNCSDAAGK